MFEIGSSKKDFGARVFENLKRDYKLFEEDWSLLISDDSVNSIISKIYHSSRNSDEAAIEVAMKILSAMIMDRKYDSAAALSKRLSASLGYFSGRNGFPEERIHSLSSLLEEKNFLLKGYIKF